MFYLSPYLTSHSLHVISIELIFIWTRYIVVLNVLNTYQNIKEWRLWGFLTHYVGVTVVCSRHKRLCCSEEHKRYWSGHTSQTIHQYYTNVYNYCLSTGHLYLLSSIKGSPKGSCPYNCDQLHFLFMSEWKRSVTGQVTNSNPFTALSLSTTAAFFHHDGSQHLWHPK